MIDPLENKGLDLIDIPLKNLLVRMQVNVARFLRVVVLNEHHCLIVLLLTRIRVVSGQGVEVSGALRVFFFLPLLWLDWF